MALAAAKLLVLCASVTACGSESDDDGAQQPLVTTCESADKFAVNVTKKTGEKGVSVALVDAKPAEPHVLPDNQWTLSVTDSSGAPVDSAKVTVSPWMQHTTGGGHGTKVREGVSNGSGTYVVSELYFSMEGVWEVTIAISKDTLVDSVKFNFCVGG